MPVAAPLIAMVCTFQDITYFNYSEFKDLWHFTKDEMIYTTNHDTEGHGLFGVEGSVRFDGDKVIFASNKKRPVYELVLQKSVFSCK